MVAHRGAARCGDWDFDGIHFLWIRDSKTLVASSRDCDVRADRCLCVDPWRAEHNSSRDHLSRDHQRFGFWWRIRLVFLSQAKRGRLFSGDREAMTQRLAEPWLQLT